jgi:hypothetical protein
LHFKENGIILFDDKFCFGSNDMRMVTKLFIAILMGAAIVFAQTADSTNKASSSMTMHQTTNDKKIITTQIPSKTPTNWSRIKDLFL